MDLRSGKKGSGKIRSAYVSDKCPTCCFLSTHLRPWPGGNLLDFSNIPPGDEELRLWVETAHFDSGEVVWLGKTMGNCP